MQGEATDGELMITIAANIKHLCMLSNLAHFNSDFFIPEWGRSLCSSEKVHLSFLSDKPFTPKKRPIFLMKGLHPKKKWQNSVMDNLFGQHKKEPKFSLIISWFYPLYCTLLPLVPILFLRISWRNLSLTRPFFLNSNSKLRKYANEIFLENWYNGNLIE